MCGGYRRVARAPHALRADALECVRFERLPGVGRL